jgi:hypothetical protein
MLEMTVGLVRRHEADLGCLDDELYSACVRWYVSDDPDSKSDTDKDDRVLKEVSEGQGGKVASSSLVRARLREGGRVSTYIGEYLLDSHIGIFPMTRHVRAVPQPDPVFNPIERPS